MQSFKNLAAFKTIKGTALPPSEWIEITQEMVNKFAESTLDFQWIHIDPERAKRESPFGTPVAHGFLSLSLLSKLIEGHFKIDSAKMGLNYGLNKVRFVSPVPVGSRLRLLATPVEIEDVEPNGVKVIWNCVIELENGEKPACVAEWITMTYE